MLTVDRRAQIRHLHFHEGLSQREIARRLGHARDTIARAIHEPEHTSYRRCEPVSHPVMDAYAAVVRAWLDQDRDRPKKQRHTAQRIWERLRDEHGFPGASCTVRRYVAKLRAHEREVFMPLAFGPGEEAQVDWHEGVAVINGVARKVQFFCMRLCYSKASFVWPYERANLESFLDGHVRAFEYFGGVPKRVAYDNLKSAVTSVGRGKARVLNERFEQMVCHYAFQTRFCNVARGNEKSDVENLAKRSERTYLTPPPEVAGMRELGDHLLAWCDRDLDRPGPRPHERWTRRQMLDQERACLARPAARPFEAYVEASTRVDQRSLVVVDGNRYSSPVSWAHHEATVRRYADRIEVWCDHRRVARHARVFGQGCYVLEPEHYLRLLAVKPGSLDNARPFKGQPWGQEVERFRRELELRYPDDGTRQFIDVLLLMNEHSVQRVKEAVSVCVRRHAFNKDAVLSVLRREPLAPVVRLDLSDRPQLCGVHDGTRSLAAYDGLFGQAMAGQEVAA